MVLGDQPHRLLLADLRIALVVGLVELDLGAAEIGQARGGAERQIFQFRMRGVAATASTAATMVPALIVLSVMRSFCRA